MNYIKLFEEHSNEWVKFEEAGSAFKVTNGILQLRVIKNDFIKKYWWCL